MIERTPEEQKAIEIFETNVIRHAQMIYPGKSSFSKDLLDPIRKDMRKNLESMKPKKEQKKEEVASPLAEAATVATGPKKKKKKKR